MVEETVGSAVLGVYLHGSATDGGLRPASDLDVFAVTRRGLAPAVRSALVEGLLPLSGRGAADDSRPVELTVVVQSQVRPWRYPPLRDFHYGEWLRAEIAANGPPQPQYATNLAIEITQLLARGRTISGPPPSALLDPVPVGDVVQASLDAIPGLLDDLAGDTRNVVLTLARIWATVATGEVLDKASAAAWALRRLPPVHRPVLRHARDLYLTSTYADEEPWSSTLLAQVERHAPAVLERIAQAAVQRRD